MFQLPLNSGSFELIVNCKDGIPVKVEFQLPLNSGSFELETVPGKTSIYDVSVAS